MPLSLPCITRAPYKVGVTWLQYDFLHCMFLDVLFLLFLIQLDLCVFLLKSKPPTQHLIQILLYSLVGITQTSAVNVRNHVPCSQFLWGLSSSNTLNESHKLQPSTSLGPGLWIPLSYRWFCILEGQSSSILLFSINILTDSIIIQCQDFVPLQLHQHLAVLSV